MSHLTNLKHSIIMGYETEIQDEIKKGFIKQIADKFVQHLEKLKDAPEYVKRRWVWELLQNAKDVKNKFQKVCVRIDKFPDRIIFSHNGDPFTVKQLTSLIQQVSSKDDTLENQETTGKFGTGFITTHLLSPVIIVKGVVCDKENRYKNFEFTLDRSGKDADELIPKIDSALKELGNLSNDTLYPVIINYDQNRKSDDLDTSFTYKFVENGKEVAEMGMADLDVSLPYTLTFNSLLSEVHIIDHEKNQNIRYKVKDVSIFDQNKRVIINKVSNGNEEEIRLVTYEGESITLALNYEIRNNNSRILQPVNETPRLFRDFPLVGSHLFDYPCVLNSRRFFPTETRDGLLLKDTKNEKVIVNRNEIKSAATHIPHFIDTGLNRKETVEKLFYLAASAIPGNISETDVRSWYEETIQKPLRADLLEKIVFYNNALSPITLKAGRVPEIEGDKVIIDAFWEICSLWMSERIPLKEDFEIWLGIIKEQYTNWKADLKFTPENLLAEIQAEGSVEKIGIKLKGISPSEWLNKIINLLIKVEKSKLLSEYAVIPDQNGELHKSGELNHDENIPTELKDVIILLGEDWKSKLVDNNICKIPQLSSLNVKSISETINDKIKDIKEGSESKAQLQGLFLLSKYIPSDQKTSRTKLYDLASEIFPDNLSGEMIVVKGTSDINWEPSTKWLIKYIIRYVNSKTSIKGLSEAYKWSTEVTINWLDRIIQYLCSNEDYRNYLEKTAIIPNQYGDFEVIQKLFNDPEKISDTLKDILYTFDKRNDWKSILLHPGIHIEAGKEKRLAEIAGLIDDQVKTSSQDRTDLEKHKKEVMTLIEMLETESAKYENPFKWLSANKAKLFMDLTVNGSDQQNVFRILKSGKDLSLLAKLAETDLEANEIERIISVRENAGKERFDELVKQLEEEHADFIYKNKLGNSIEELFREAIEKENLPCEVYRVDGAQDFILTNSSNKQYYVEIKSIGMYSDFVRVGRSQARNAVTNPNSYCLCILRRENSSPDAEYFRNSANLVTNIGYKMKDAVTRSEAIANEISSDNSDFIHIDFDDPRFKFKVKQSVWNDSQKFSEFVQHLKRYFAS